LINSSHAASHAGGYREICCFRSADVTINDSTATAEIEITKFKYSTAMFVDDRESQVALRRYVVLHEVTRWKRSQVVFNISLFLFFTCQCILYCYTD